MNSLVWEKCHRDAYPGMCIIHSYAAPHLQNEKKYPRKPYTAPTTTRCHAARPQNPAASPFRPMTCGVAILCPASLCPASMLGQYRQGETYRKPGRPPRCSSSRALMMKPLGWIRNYLFFDSNDCHLSRSTFGACVSALWMTVSDSKYTV